MLITTARDAQRAQAWSAVLPLSLGELTYAAARAVCRDERVGSRRHGRAHGVVVILLFSGSRGGGGRGRGGGRWWAGGVSGQNLAEHFAVSQTCRISSLYAILTACADLLRAPLGRPGCGTAWIKLQPSSQASQQHCGHCRPQDSQFQHPLVNVRIQHLRRNSLHSIIKFAGVACWSCGAAANSGPVMLPGTAD
jgi:hypothetical protein